ncbi:MAG: methionine--tRNA ligase [Magnetococcales bacterium]|nr:methionine--tRNA ligase [Magnetococcales bacterium]
MPQPDESRAASQPQRRILVTSALPYANGSIHLGHLVEAIQTDIWVRYHRLRGRDCRYVCADDTHGSPIMISAQRQGISPEALVTRMHEEHLADFAGFAIQFDNYYSTNSPENRQLSEEVYRKLKAAGHIYTERVRQAYCPKDGMFLPDRFIRGTCPRCGARDQYGDACEACGATYSPLELGDAGCSLCGSAPEERESEHYFFRLENFTDFLRSWTRSGALQTEMINKLEEWFAAGLKSWDISRDGPYFGFEIPDAPGKYFYVWLDAPIGYMASTRNLCERLGLDFEAYWRRDDVSEVYHFIGKDILYFHTLFWPAMLEGAGFRKPTAVFAHGFLTVNGAKMSKSRGTFINARDYLAHLDPEYLRYYYATKLTPRVDDLDLSLDDFILKVNSDLVGKVVNLASRTAGFLEKRFGGCLAAVYPDDEGLFARFVDAGDELAELYESREYGQAMRRIMGLADAANRFVEDRAPWLLAKDPGKKAQLLDACSVAINLFRLLLTYLKPVLPATSARVEAFLQAGELSWEGRREPLVGHTVGRFSHLMVRVDPKKVEAMLQASQAAGGNEGKPGPVASSPGESQKEEPAAEIGMELFGQVDLRVGRVEAASLVTGADKLLELTIDLGPLGRRRIFAGIRLAYDPATLIGRLVVVVANLKPRKMKFGTSEGMVLAAGGGGKELFLLAPDAGASPGQRVA